MGSTSRPDKSGLRQSLTTIIVYPINIYARLVPRPRNRTNVRSQDVIVEHQHLEPDLIDGKTTIIVFGLC